MTITLNAVFRPVLDDAGAYLPGGVEAGAYQERKAIRANSK